MKKIVSLAAAFCIILLSFTVPFSAQAKDKNNDEGMYTVTSELFCDAYMLINLDDETHPVIAQKNKDKREFPASLTKIVTAIVALSKLSDLDAKTTVSKNAVAILSGSGAQVAGLEVGEEVSVEKLLELVLVYSACDACNVIAEYAAGSIPAFVKLMNNWVKSIGCENTNFVNCEGLHDDNHYTTPSDMALITLEAIKNETFNRISSMKKCEFHGYTFIHTNFMLDRAHVTYYYEYADGIKTGSTSQAGYCVITKAQKDGYNYLAIIMGSPEKMYKGYMTKFSFIDAATLFDWAFDSLKYSTVIKSNDIVYEIPVINGKDSDSVGLISKGDVTALVPASLDPSAVMITPVEPPEQLEAPITQGEKICEANVIYGDKIIASVDLVASQTVELSTFLKIYNSLKNFFGRKEVLLAILVLIALLIIYIYVFVKRLRRDKKRSAAKRRRREALDEQLNREYQERRGRDDYLPPPKR